MSWIYRGRTEAEENVVELLRFTSNQLFFWFNILSGTGYESTLAWPLRDIIEAAHGRLEQSLIKYVTKGVRVGKS